MAAQVLGALLLCTDNSARGIFAESIINRFGQRYLTIWVGLCIIGGDALGHRFPLPSGRLAAWKSRR